MALGDSHLEILLPTIRDGVDLGDVANKRDEISVGVQQRKDLMRRYNHAINDLANKIGKSYFDITDAVLDRFLRLVT